MLMQAFDTFIGLVSVFLILSLIVSALGEGVSSLLSFKGKNLKRSISTLLDANTAEAFFAHDSIQRLRKERWGRVPRLPAYLPDTLIAEVIVDLCVNPPADNKGKDEAAIEKKPVTPNTVNRAIADLSTSYGPALRQLWRKSECDLDRFKGLIAEWFNLTGDRSVGWFRRKLAFSLFVIGFLVAAFLNADTLYMFNTLSNDATLRESFVEYATDIVDEAREVEIPCDSQDCEDLVNRFVADDSQPLETEEEAVLQELCNQDDSFDSASCRADLQTRLDKRGQACRTLGVTGECDLQSLISTALPEVTPLLGLDLLKAEYAALPEMCGENPAVACGEWFGLTRHEGSFFALKFLGWLITAAAVSLGAPFWFDLLQKVVQIRSSVKPTTSAPVTASSGQSAVATTAAVPAARTVIRAGAVDSSALDDLGKFDAKTFGYSPLNLFWSARLAKLAYLPEKALIAAELEEWGAEGELLDWKHSQCIVARTPRAAFVSFRGTESNLQDWLTDARVSLKAPSWDSKAGYQVHTGFNDGLNLVWDNADGFVGLAETLKRLRVFEQKVPIWLSGHSLGGALAALASLRLSHYLAEQEYGNIIGGVHTFGQPRVGDPGCAEALEKLFPARYLRSVNNRDIVPRVPLPKTPDVMQLVKERNSDLKILDYRHAGKVIYFNDAGKAMMDPPIWYRRLDTLGVGTSMDEIQAAAKETASDHSMSNYVDLHRKLLAVTEIEDSD